MTEKNKNIYEFLLKRICYELDEEYYLSETLLERERNASETSIDYKACYIKSLEDMYNLCDRIKNRLNDIDRVVNGEEDESN